MAQLNLREGVAIMSEECKLCGRWTCSEEFFTCSTCGGEEIDEDELEEDDDYA